MQFRINPRSSSLLAVAAMPLSLLLLTLSTTAQAQFDLQSRSEVDFENSSEPHAQNLQSSTPGPLHSSVSLSRNDSTGTAFGAAMATANAGILRASITGSSSSIGLDAGSLNSADLSAKVFVLDNVIFRGTPAQAGQHVTVTASWLVSGSVAASAGATGAGSSTGMSRVSFTGSGVPDLAIPGLQSNDIAGSRQDFTHGVQTTLYNIAAPPSIPISFDVILGGTFSLQYNLLLFGRASSSVLNGSTASENSQSTLSALFDSTIAWGGVSSIRDSSGNLITNYTVTSVSGFDYKNAASVSAATPEPGSLATLFGCGSVMISMIRIARRRRRR